MDRDEQIIALYREGKSFREIGELVGLSHMGVKKKVDKLGANQVIVGPVIKEDESLQRIVDPQEYPGLDEPFRKMEWEIRNFARILRDEVKGLNGKHITIQTGNAKICLR